jgi:hypothetical protein
VIRFSPDPQRHDHATGSVGKRGQQEYANVTCSERKKEIKRRRHRRKKLTQFGRRAPKATVSEKAHIAAKIRRMTPGAEIIITRLALEER